MDPGFHVLRSPSSDWLGRPGKLAGLVCGHSWWVLGLGSWKQNQELELCALIMVCGLALSTEQSQRDAEILFFLFSFFPSFCLFPLSFFLSPSRLPAFSLPLSVDVSCYQHSEKSFIKMTSIKTLSPKSLWGPGRGHQVGACPQSLGVTGQDTLPLAGEGSPVLRAPEAPAGHPPPPALPAEKSGGSVWDAAAGLTPAGGGRLGDRWAPSAVPPRARLTGRGQLLRLGCGVWTRRTLRWEGAPVTARAPQAPSLRAGPVLCVHGRGTSGPPSPGRPWAWGS